MLNIFVICIIFLINIKCEIAFVHFVLNTFVFVCLEGAFCCLYSFHSGFFCRIVYSDICPYKRVPELLTACDVCACVFARYRCSGQQGEKEGHIGAEVEQSALCPRQAGSWEAGQSRAHGSVVAEQGAVGGHPHTDWYRTHTVIALSATHTHPRKCKLHWKTVVLNMNTAVRLIVQEVSLE